MYELISAQISALWDQYYAHGAEYPGLDTLLDRIEDLEAERAQYSPTQVYYLCEDY